MPKKFHKEVTPELVNYIETTYYPVYETFDHGHDVNHIEAVIERAFDIAGQVGDVDGNLVYAAAALHDIGIKDGREGHSTHSRKFVEQDENLERFFSKEEISILAEAVEDHSTSRGCEPRNIYGKIVCDADKDLDVETSLLRAYEFTVSYFPDKTEEEWADNVFNHLNYKFGENGIVRFWTGASQQHQFAEQMRKIAMDRSLFDEFLADALANRS